MTARPSARDQSNRFGPVRVPSVRCRDGRRLRRPGDRSQVAGALARVGHLRGRQRRPAPALLHAVHVPVPERGGAHGPRAQLHLRRPDRPPPHDERLRRAVAHGLRLVRPAGRERRHQDRRAPPAVHRRPHRAAAQSIMRHRRRSTTGAGRSEPRPRLHPLDPVDLPAPATRPAWPTARTHRSTGTRSTRPCWPTSRCWPTAPPSGRAPWSRSATSSSGSSRSPTTPTSCSTTSTTSTGPSGSRSCSATGSAGPRAPSSTWP